MPTEMELTLEQTQQGVSYEVSVLSDIEDSHGPSDAMHNPLPATQSQKDFVSKLTEIHSFLLTFSLRVILTVFEGYVNGGGVFLNITMVLNLTSREAFFALEHTHHEPQGGTHLLLYGHPLQMLKNASYSLPVLGLCPHNDRHRKSNCSDGLLVNDIHPDIDRVPKGWKRVMAKWNASWSQRKKFPGALLHNTIAQVMREQPLTVSFEKKF
ncbi:hypothetical protein Tco_1516030 [Tanacetum coccineum]